MKKSIKVLVFSAILFATGCVTTRAQLNEKNGVVEDGEVPAKVSEDGTNRSNSHVKSEDITPSPAEAPVPKSPSTPATKMTTDTNTTASAAAPTTAGSTPAPMTAGSPPAPIAQASVSTIAANGGAYSEDELKIELARVSGQVEEMQHEKQLSEQQRQDADKKYQDRIAELEKQLKANEPPPAPAVPVAPAGKSNFEAGKEAYIGGKYEEAISFFDQYLQGNNLKSADEATYLRAEANFRQKNYKKAIIDYSKFPEKFQKSPFHPKALLGIAQSFDEMGMKDDAKAFYSDLAEKYPKTAEGKLAKKKLKKK